VGPLELVWRTRLRYRKEPQRRIERAGVEMRSCGGERSVRPSRGVTGQRDRPLQKRRRGGQPAACLRTTRRALKLRRHLFVRCRRRSGEVPRAAIRVCSAIRHLGQRGMDSSPLLSRG
jgi:hypothetical protein